VRNPVHFEEAGLPELNKAPYLGEHTDDVLMELGYSRSEIDELLEAGKIVINKKP
jgi:cinnamoyl-CoA:phenyllactate CoA-transferase